MWVIDILSISKTAPWSILHIKVCLHVCICGKSSIKPFVAPEESVCDLINCLEVSPFFFFSHILPFQILMSQLFPQCILAAE